MHVRLRDASIRGLVTIGLGRRGAIRAFAIGAATGAVLVSGVVAVLAAAGWYEVVSAELALRRFIGWAALFMAVAVTEEIVARGLLFTVVARRFGVVAAIAVSAVIFGALHLGNPGATAMSLIGIAIHAGLLLPGLLLLTRSLWAPIGAHLTWNLFEGPVWGMEVSGVDATALVEARLRGPELWTGGAFGPEAGLVMIVLGGAAGIGLLHAARRSGRLAWPPALREAATSE